MNVRLTHIDGKLPNLALMRLSAYHKARGDKVYFSKSVTRELFEVSYDRVYGSAIFRQSTGRLKLFLDQFPDAVMGGTGAWTWETLEQRIPGIPDEYDYLLYPDFHYSIGFLQRGCRLRCGFCVVPKKEGKPRHNMTVMQLWRGDPFPKKLHILDNDFFGVPEWKDHIRDIRDGGFKVCLNQGINIRLIDEEAADALAQIKYMDDGFKRRRLYTAWDNLKDEKVFFRGVDRLTRAGIPASHLMVYMLVGYAKDETMDRVLYRFNKMADIGIRPYPMVYDRSNKQLCRFQRWAVRGYHRFIPWGQYQTHVPKQALPQPGLFDPARSPQHG